MIPSKRSVPNRLASTAASKAPPAAPSAQLAERVKYEILPVTEVSEPELEAFYAATYSERIGFLKSNWRWLYRLGAFDWASPPLVAVANRQIVGCLGNIPVMLRRGKNEHRAAWLVDLAIHPGLQRQGIGMALAKTAMAHYPILLGFGNERSQGALVKCGWQLRQNTQSFQLLLHPEQHPKFQRAAYSSLARVAGLATRVTWQARAMLQKEISAEPISPERIAEFASQDFGDALHVARSEAFLNWRIVQHPHQAEHVVLRQQAGGAGKYKAIARISNENGFRAEPGRANGQNGAVGIFGQRRPLGGAGGFSPRPACYQRPPRRVGRQMVAADFNHASIYLSRQQRFGLGTSANFGALLGVH